MNFDSTLIEAKQNEAYAINIVAQGNEAYATNIVAQGNEVYATNIVTQENKAYAMHAALWSRGPTLIECVRYIHICYNYYTVIQYGMAVAEKLAGTC